MTDAERLLTPKELRDRYAEFVQARQALGCDDGLLRQFMSDLAVAERMLAAHDAAYRAIEAERHALLVALKAAAQFLYVDIDRGPAVTGWENTVNLVVAAIARAEGKI